MFKTNRMRWGALLALLGTTFGAHRLYQAHARGLDAPADAIASVGPEGSPPVGNPPVSSKLSPNDVRAGDESVQVTAHVDRTAVMHRGEGTVHLEVSVKTTAAPGALERVPSDLVVIVDRSGSMQGEKIEYAKQALRKLIERLRPEDRFALVTYESEAEVRVPLATATPEARTAWLREVSTLDVAGGTNMSGGLDLGHRELERKRSPNRAGRVLLLSDGLANQGDSSLAGLVRRARRAVGGEYVLSTIGIGADFDERVMTALASSGTGAFYYLAKLETLPVLLDAELKTATETVAQGAELRLRPGSGVRVVSAGGLPVTYERDEAVIALGSLYGDHERKLWVKLEAQTGELRDLDIGDLRLRYRKGEAVHELRSPTLPKLACVADPALFRSRLVRDVWERAILEEELTHAQEKLGDAIASGSEAEVDAVVSRVTARRELAQQLGSTRVLEGIGTLTNDAERAREAQRAPAPARAVAAKAAKARGYNERNKSAYKNVDPGLSY